MFVTNKIKRKKEKKTQDKWSYNCNKIIVKLISDTTYKFLVEPKLWRNAKIFRFEDKELIVQNMIT